MRKTAAAAARSDSRSTSRVGASAIRGPAISLLALAGLAPAGLAPAGPAAAAPSGPKPASPPLRVAEAVCRPTIDLDGHPKTTGTAFLLQTPGPDPRRLLVAAHHLFGLGAGALAWRTTPDHVGGAICPTLDRSATFRTGPALAVEGAHAMGDLYTLRDIALLPVVEAQGARVTPLRLAETPPAPGDPVWLAAQTFDAKTFDAKPPDARTSSAEAEANVLHRGRVLDAWGFLAFVYDERGLNLRETSGAPVVNARGEVVGVNVGYTIQPNGEVAGVADDLDTLRAAISGTEPPP